MLLSDSGLGCCSIMTAAPRKSGGTFVGWGKESGTVAEGCQSWPGQSLETGSEMRRMDQRKHAADHALEPVGGHGSALVPHLLPSPGIPVSVCVHVER